jgi:class 3 adenylate cyclase
MHCSACQRENPPEAHFCLHCGTALAPGPPAIVPALEDLDGERRQLTVLFCDLMGSTRLALRLDPEDWREIVRAYQRMCAESVARFEGHVAQYLGDGVLVYFGHPRAQENDPERAVRAGLAITRGIQEVNEGIEREHGVTLGVRVGIHTGPVVVGSMGNAASHEELALGDTTNVAAHLEGLAPRDSVVVSAATARLVQGLFAVQDCGHHVLKAEERPVRAYVVLGESEATHRFEAAALRGLTPLVGREEELSALLGHLEGAARGEGRTVSLRGEPGIGKTRLLHAFRERAAADEVGWMASRCSFHGESSALLPVLDLVREGLGLSAGTSHAAGAARLEDVLGRANLPVEQAVPLLSPLLSLPVPERFPALDLSPEAQRRIILGSLAALLVGLAQAGTTVIVLEDLHWADPSSVELLGLLREAVRQARVLVLLTYRSEFAVPWSEGERDEVIELLPLPPSQAARMIARASRKPMPPDLTQQITEKTGGVPLFVEELTRMVIESGQLREQPDRYELAVPVVELSVPATLHDSLRARLDRLGPAKALAQLAAVIGREFDQALLSRVADAEEADLAAGLAELVDAGLMYPVEGPPRPRFEFKHALIRDVAYGSLLRRTRRSIHGLVGDALERDFPGAASLQPELVAHHFTEARRPEAAIPYWQAASELAVQGHGGPEAARHLERAIELCAQLEESPERTQREAALRKALCGMLYLNRPAGAPEIGEELVPARAACERAGRVSDLHKVLWMLSGYHDTRAEYEPGCAAARAGLDLADEALDWDDDFCVWTARSGHCATLAFALLCMGRFEECLAVTEMGKATYARSAGFKLEVGLTNPGVAAYAVAAWNRWLLGFPDQAVADARRATEIVSDESAAHAWSRAFGHGLAAVVHLHRREPRAARAQAEAVVKLATERGMEYWIGSGLLQQSWARAAAGESAAIEEFEGLMGFAQSSESRIAGSVWLGGLAASYLGAGRAEQALQVVALSEAFANAVGENIWRSELLRLRGEALLMQSSSENAKAKRAFHAAIEVAREQGARSWELRASTSLARLLLREGQPAHAHDALAEVYDWFSEGFDTPDLQEARGVLEQLA